MTKVLGIDIGGTGIKGAPVDTVKGKLLAERFRIETPQPASPKAVLGCLKEMVAHFDWKGPVGITLPAVVKAGRVHTAANIDPAWIGLEAESFFSKGLKLPVVVLNDADAAGIAEMELGAGRRQKGIVLLVTLGTGIGTALFHDGVLLPNSELGHIELDGRDAERKASNRARETKELSWKAWSKNVNQYLGKLEELLWPDLFILGGGVSKKADKFVPRLDLKARVTTARLLNDAGIVGAALAARGARMKRASVRRKTSKRGRR